MLPESIESLTGEPNRRGVVNPTTYGHGFLLNDLALEGTVPYHEGMHAITTPIAGLEGGEEASALNEGQADMWAFTITDNASLGDYVVNAKGYRDRARSRGIDPDSIAYIRSARSTLKYSDIGTLFFAEAAEVIPSCFRAARRDTILKSITTAKFICRRCGTSAKCSNRVYPQMSDIQTSASERRSGAESDHRQERKFSNATF